MAESCSERDPAGPAETCQCVGPARPQRCGGCNPGRPDPARPDPARSGLRPGPELARAATGAGNVKPVGLHQRAAPVRRRQRQQRRRVAARRSGVAAAASPLSARPTRPSVRLPVDAVSAVQGGFVDWFRRETFARSLRSSRCLSNSRSGDLGQPAGYSTTLAQQKPPLSRPGTWVVPGEPAPRRVMARRLSFGPRNLNSFRTRSDPASSPGDARFSLKLQVRTCFERKNYSSSKRVRRPGRIRTGLVARSSTSTAAGPVAGWRGEQGQPCAGAASWWPKLQPLNTPPPPGGRGCAVHRRGAAGARGRGGGRVGGSGGGRCKRRLGERAFDPCVPPGAINRRLAGCGLATCGRPGRLRRLWTHGRGPAWSSAKASRRRQRPSTQARGGRWERSTTGE